MNICIFEGRIGKLKMNGKGDKKYLTFTLSVRKDYISEKDKEANKINNFLFMKAFGKTAEFIEQYFEDGKHIGVTCSYETWEGKDDDGDTTYNHNFNIIKANFVGGKDDGDDSGSKSSKSDDDDAKAKAKAKKAKAAAKAAAEAEDDGEDLDDDGSLPF